MKWLVKYHGSVRGEDERERYKAYICDEILSVIS